MHCWVNSIVWEVDQFHFFKPSMILSQRMSVIKDPIFDNKEPLPMAAMRKFKLKSCANIGQDLVKHLAWDLVQPVASVALRKKTSTSVCQVFLGNWIPRELMQK